NIQHQIEALLNNYYDRNTYIVSVNVNLDRLKISKENTKETSGIELPGLPYSPDSTKGVFDEIIIPDKFKINNISISISLDNSISSQNDIDFIRSIVKSQVPLDPTRGDSLRTNIMSFPKGIKNEEKQKALAKEFLIESKDKTNKILKKIYSYLFWIGLIILITFLVILGLVLYNIKRTRKRIAQIAEDTKSRVYPMNFSADNVNKGEQISLLQNKTKANDIIMN
ncbi:hypothetical protein ACFL4O_03675, partial [bacterium]